MNKIPKYGIITLCNYYLYSLKERLFMSLSFEKFERIKNAVHQPLNWDDYNSTAVIEDTNCLSHAFGSTVTSAIEAYRLGSLSGKKKLKDGYFSKDEVKNLFYADAESVELKIEEIPFENLSTFLKYISEIKLAENQHIVALFVKVYGREEYISDFHFLRFDKGKGWTEKRRPLRITFIEDISRDWPSAWNDKLIGVFKVTR